MEYDIKSMSHQCTLSSTRSGLEIIKLGFILKLKTKCSDWLLADTSAMIGCMRTCVHKQPIIALYFEFETVLKFYNLEARIIM